MQFFSWILVAIGATLAAAQSQNVISIPPGGLQINAGQPATITWSNPSAGTVTIKLQQGSITPESGYVLISGIPASDGTATFTVPASADSAPYVIEIIDDTNPSNYNFSPAFAVNGATGTGLPTTASATNSASSASASSASSASSVSSASSASSASSSASSGSSSASKTTSSDKTTSSTSSSSATQTSSASSSTQSTSVPTSNAASRKGQGALLAGVVGAIAFL